METVPVKRAIRVAAAELFRDRGYHGTSLRDIADRVGIKVPSLYNHLTSKQALLHEILHGSMVALLDHTDAALASAGPEPSARLRAFVRALVEIQAGLALEASVMIEELRALDEPHRSEVIAQRDAYQAVLEDILRAGVAGGVFVAADLKLTAYAIIGMGRDVADWFRPGGRLPVDAIAAAYEGFALAMVRPPT
jgi:AcrR family transcriptional regulator